MNKIKVLAGGVAVVLCGMFAFGGDEKKSDDVETLVTKALKDYKDGKVNDAITGLQSAITIMQKSQQKGMSAFMPKAPNGWEAGEIKSDSVAGTGNETTINYTIVSCKYTKTGAADSTVEIRMTNSPVLVDAQKQMVEAYKDPAVIAAANSANADVKLSTIDRDGWVGWMIAQKDGESTANILNGATLVMVEVKKGDESVVKAFLDAMDLKGLASLGAVQSKGQESK